jgi:hypothetical protein
MTMRARIFSSLLALSVALSLAAPAFAQERWHDDYHHDDYDHHGEFRHDGWWRDHDIHHFRDHDFALWRQGQWFHARHDGRFGWWWVVGGVWYFYPAPIYPYPDPLVPAYTTASAPAAPAWYFCQPSQAYYPYVPTCPVPWQVVPAQ